MVNVVKDSCKTTLPLVVVEGKGPPLLGRNWLANIPINWQHIKSLSSVPKCASSNVTERLNTLLAKYPRKKGWKQLLELKER